MADKASDPALKAWDELKEALKNATAYMELHATGVVEELNPNARPFNAVRDALKRVQFHARGICQGVAA